MNGRRMARAPSASGMTELGSEKALTAESGRLAQTNPFHARRCICTFERSFDGDSQMQPSFFVIMWAALLPGTVPAARLMQARLRRSVTGWS